MNIVCTSKPHDGLLYYSYEYTALLNQSGYPTKLFILCHPGYNQNDYLDALDTKYQVVDNVTFDDDPDDVSIILGRSMLTIAYYNLKHYDGQQQLLAYDLFSDVVAVYSENHFEDYYKAIECFGSRVTDIGDTEVYKFKGIHFEKRINFDIYRPIVKDHQFKYLFNGTNKQYYERVKSLIHNYPDHGILMYPDQDHDQSLNNLPCPVDNLLGMFDTYVYTKHTFDPAPRIVQECKYYNIDMIYARPSDLIDGGSVYWERDIVLPDISPILEAANENRT